MTNNYHTWASSVRGYELDNQQIVNNANYLHYFNNARILCLQSKGINWEQWHRDGYNLVLIQSTLKFKAPLLAFDKFEIRTTYEKIGKLKVVFLQELFKTDNNKLCATAENIVVCVEIKTGKPVWQKEIDDILFKSM